MSGRIGRKRLPYHKGKEEVILDTRYHTTLCGIMTSKESDGDEEDEERFMFEGTEHQASQIAKIPEIRYRGVEINKDVVVRGV